MWCDWYKKEDPSACGHPYDSVVFSDDLYLVFCPNHQHDALIATIKHLHEYPDIFLEGEYPKEWDIHPTRVKPERSR